MNNVKIELIKQRHKLNPLRLIWPDRKIVKRRKTPESWEELTIPQLRLVAKLIMQDDEENLGSKIITSFLNIPMRHLKYMNMSQMSAAIGTINFVFEKDTLLINRFPVLTVEGNKYTGPTKAIADISFEQFIFADTIFLRFMREKTPELLNQLIATLYIRQGQSFTPDNIEADADIMNGLSEDIKLLILLFYTAGRNKLTSEHRNLFPELDKNQQKTAQKSNFSWADLLFELVGDKPADKRKIDNLNVYFAIGYLDNKAKHNQQKQTSNAS